MASVEANGITIEYEDTGGPERPAIVLIRGPGTQLIDGPAELVDALAGERAPSARLERIAEHSSQACVR